MGSGYGFTDSSVVSFFASKDGDRCVIHDSCAQTMKALSDLQHNFCFLSWAGRAAQQAKMKEARRIRRG